jgi:hypothetical protein
MDGAFGTLGCPRQSTLIDEQDGVRWNRDTLYSSSVFDWRGRRCVPVIWAGIVRQSCTDLARVRRRHLDATGWVIERWAELDQAAERIDVQFG